VREEKRNLEQQMHKSQYRNLNMTNQGNASPLKPNKNSMKIPKIKN
jgi:hypothetical protein